MKAGNERVKPWEFQLQLSLLAGLQLSFCTMKVRVIVLLLEEWPQSNLIVDYGFCGGSWGLV